MKFRLSEYQKDSWWTKSQIYVLTESFYDKKVPISKIRGEWLDIDVNGQKYKSMPIFHPSYLLRNHSMEAGKPRALMLEDLKKIRDIINS